MTRDELNADMTEWKLPPARTKNKREHVIPLAPLARAQIPNADDGRRFIFTTSGTAPIGGWSKQKRKLDAAMGVPPWRLHDLRRTAASGLQRLGVRAEAIERALNHVSGIYRGVAGIYQRDPLTDEVKDALERWATHVGGLVADRPANVTPMRARRRPAPAHRTA
jgi:integrase